WGEEAILLTRALQFLIILRHALQNLSAFGSLQVRWPSVGHRFLRHHGHSWTHALHTVDHDLIPGIEAIAHDALAVDNWPQRHGLISDGVWRRQGEHIFSRLVG